MSRSKSCIICFIISGLVAAITMGVFLRFLDDAIVMRYALAIMFVPTILILTDAKSKSMRFIVYTLLLIVLMFGYFYAIYYRRPFGFYVIFCAFVGFVYYFVLADKSTKDNLCTKIIVPTTLATTIVLLALSANLMFNPIHAPLLNGGSVIW